MPVPRVARRCLRIFLPTLLGLWPLGVVSAAQTRPMEISLAQSTELPYRLSGQLNVTFSGSGYFGTSTYVRRYTGLTAGHLLYDRDSGLATNPYYLPAFYKVSTARIPVDYFAVLSGYQGAANAGPDANPAFAYDMGYVLFDRPAPNAEWAAFGNFTQALTEQTNFLVLGYAADTFVGDEQAFVKVSTSYYNLLPALYENSDYYTEEGMSGGPLYVTGDDGAMTVSAVTVAGTSRPDPPLSDVRAITDAEIPLFTEAEYAHGLIPSGVIRGPATVAAGGVGKYKTGVVFKDGVQEGRDLPATYDELVLTPIGAHKKLVSVTKLKTGKFKVKFSSDLANGTTVTLGLMRNTVAKSAQIPLKTFSVKVQ